jgi:hypothetical protein
MFLQATFVRRPANLAPGLLIGAVVLWLCLSGTVETFVARAGLFYLATAAAYATMPYVRRGDIPLAAMWIVLGAELAPLMEGRLISPATVAADVAGVVMAAAPIFIARARQVMQGDLRPHHRRGREKASA